MAKKTKTQEEKPKKESKYFDVESAIEKLEIPEILKIGFRFYLINNNIKIQSENDLNTKLKNFKTMNAGE